MCIVHGVQNKCRLCLTDNEEKLSIFDPQFCDGIPLSMKILVCVSVTVTPGDSFTKLICSRCLSLINSFYEFREECMNTHMKLIQYEESTDDNQAGEVAGTSGDAGNGQELMYTEALQINEVSDVTQDKFEETVTVICGNLESSEEGSQEGINVFEEVQDSLMLDITSDDSIERDQNKESIGNAEEVSEGNCYIQLEKLADNTYVLKAIEDEEVDNPSSDFQKGHKCPTCIKSFSTDDALEKHYQVCAVQQEVIEIKEEPVELLPKKHQRARWGEGRTYPCPTCGKVFKVPAMLRNHERVHTGERPFMCSLCSRSFTQSYALRNHELQHRGESSYPCEQCGKGFFRPSDLEKHIRSHTDERPFLCSMCSKSFHQLSGLIVHERIHTGERPYSCSFCSMSFNQWANKQRHEKTHAGGAKPHSCDLCFRKFSEREEMELHRAGHGGGRPRVCQFCTKSFRKPSELRDHMRRMHTNERPYQCKLCTKAFFVPHELKQHLMVHTGERPHSCQFCNHTFSQKGNLKRHLLQRHKELIQMHEQANLICEQVDLDDMQLTEIEVQ